MKSTIARTQLNWAKGLVITLVLSLLPSFSGAAQPKNSNPVDCAGILGVTLPAIQSRVVDAQANYRKGTPVRSFADFGFDQSVVDPGEDGPKVLSDMHPSGVRFLQAQLIGPESDLVLKKDRGGHYVKLTTTYGDSVIQTGANFVYRHPPKGRKGDFAFGKEFASEGVVLWLHGGGTPTANSTNASTEFGLNVLAIDLGGHGNSDQYPFKSGLDQLLYLSEVIRQHIHPSVPVTIAGHSWGGQFALQFFLEWAHIPEDVRAHVKALVSLSPPVDPSNGGTALQRLQIEGTHKFSELTKEELSKIAESDFEFLSSMVMQGKIAPSNSLCCTISATDFQFRVPTDKLPRPQLTVIVGKGDGLVRIGHGREKIQDDFFRLLIRAGLMSEDQYIVMGEARTFKSKSPTDLMLPGHDIYPFYMSPETKLQFQEFLGPDYGKADVFEVYTRLAKIVAGTVTPAGEKILPPGGQFRRIEYISKIIDEALEGLSESSTTLTKEQEEKVEQAIGGVRTFQNEKGKLTGEVLAKYQGLLGLTVVKNLSRELQLRSVLREVYDLYTWNLAFRDYAKNYVHREMVSTPLFHQMIQEQVRLKPFVAQVEEKARVLQKKELEDLDAEVAALEKAYGVRRGQFNRELNFQRMTDDQAAQRLAVLSNFVQIATPIRDQIQRNTKEAVAKAEASITPKPMNVNSRDEARAILGRIQNQEFLNGKDPDSKEKRKNLVRELNDYLVAAKKLIEDIQLAAFLEIEKKVGEKVAFPEHVAKVIEAETELSFVRNQDRLKLLTEFGQKLTEIENRRIRLTSENGKREAHQRAFELALTQIAAPKGFGSAKDAYERSMMLLGIEKMTYVPPHKSGSEDLSKKTETIIKGLEEVSSIMPGLHQESVAAIEAQKAAVTRTLMLEKELSSLVDGTVQLSFAQAEKALFDRAFKHYAHSVEVIESAGQAALADRLSKGKTLSKEDILEIQAEVSKEAPNYLRDRAEFLRGKHQYHQAVITKIVNGAPGVPKDWVKIGQDLKLARERLREARLNVERRLREIEVLGHRRFSLEKKYWSYVPGYRNSVEIQVWDLLQNQTLEGLYNEILNSQQENGQAKFEALRALVNGFNLMWLTREPIEKVGGEVN